MSEIIGNNRKRLLRGYTVNHAKCICIAHSWHVEVIIKMQYCGFEPKTEV